MADIGRSLYKVLRKNYHILHLLSRKKEKFLHAEILHIRHIASRLHRVPGSGRFHQNQISTTTNVNQLMMANLSFTRIIYSLALDFWQETLAKS